MQGNFQVVHCEGHDMLNIIIYFLLARGSLGDAVAGVVVDDNINIKIVGNHYSKCKAPSNIRRVSMAVNKGEFLHSFPFVKNELYGIFKGGVTYCYEQLEQGSYIFYHFFLRLFYMPRCL